MANPKYADLPGIAYEQPDIYETEDLPESDQVISDVGVDQSDSVNTLAVSVTEAYDKFKGCTVDASTVDFTEGISRQPKEGYHVISGEWELAGDKEPENLQQKYQRLQFEVRELLNEVQSIKESAQEGDRTGLAEPAHLLQQAQLIQKMLLDLDLERVLGAATLQALSDPQAALHRTLVSQLEQLRTGPPPATPQVKEKPHAEPAQDAVQTTIKVAGLEERIKKLENLVGTDSQKLSMLTSHTSGSCLTEIAQLLCSRLHLLESSHLDQVEARLSLLQQKMQQCADKKTALEEIDKTGKVNELYELLKKADAMGNSLNQVVERLVCLQGVHEHALQFSKAVSQLDLVQQHLSLSLKSNEKNLAEVQKNFAENTETITKNLALLEAKMAALKK
ncbi:dynactin subunit 2-A [Dermacentor andersoni]|uniref:dynactin subunit 2-A n=1 Tax=Dermacentor andersoni TaxID=34620 RepID=UPI002155BABC|nr:dynactin subunit 2-A-like [Dermacentor andersoni]